MLEKPMRAFALRHTCSIPIPADAITTLVLICTALLVCYRRLELKDAVKVRPASLPSLLLFTMATRPTATVFTVFLLGNSADHAHACTSRMFTVVAGKVVTTNVGHLFFSDFLWPSDWW
jgi:hypothetical protein